MALNTYTDLINGIQAWVEDVTSDFTDDLNDIVDLGEKRLLRDLDLAIFRRVDSTLTLTASTAEATKATISSPDLRIATKAVWLTGGGLSGPVFLEQRSYEYVTMYNSGASDGTPKFYGEKDEDTFIFGAPPDDTYTVNERFISRPEPLSTSNETNWLSDNAYDILFKACLAEACAFLKNMGLKTAWDMDYEAALPMARKELYNLFGNQYDQLGAVPVPQAPRSNG